MFCKFCRDFFHERQQIPMEVWQCETMHVRLSVVLKISSMFLGVSQQENMEFSC